MQKPKTSHPNWRLTRARELRGWSQEELAARIDAHPKNVSRWERGITTPLPRFREKLCELFGMNAEELGFLEEEATLKTEPSLSDHQEDAEELLQFKDRAEEKHNLDELPLDEPIRQEIAPLLNWFQQIVLHLQKESFEDFRWKELKDAYLELLAVSEARLKYAGTVEALRRYNGIIAYQYLPEAKAECDQAEQAFDEGSVRRILTLFDNNKVWWHYYRATDAYQEYCKRTKELVEQAMQPRSPLSVIVPRLHIMLNPSLDDDPATRKIYEQIYSTMNAMQKAMNKRLRL